MHSLSESRIAKCLYFFEKGSAFIMENILDIFLGLSDQMLDRALCFVDESIPDDCSVVESSLIGNDLEIVFKNEDDEEYVFSKSFDFNNKNDRGDYNFIVRGIQPISRVA